MPDERDPDSSDDEHVDAIDREAAQIDARSEDAPEEIEEVIEDAHSVGRDAPGEDAAPN